MAGGAQQPTVALLGTGIMGAGMGRSMLRAGLPLRAWNRTEARAKALEPAGAVVAPSPADAVRGADVIVTMLPSADVVEDVMRQAVPGLRRGQVWAQTSTVGLAGVKQLARFAAEHDLVFVDSPVLGTRQPAERGALTVFAAGPDRAREWVQPVFDAIGEKTVWLGTAAGAASRLKLVVNNWVIAVNNATGETMALARGLGVDQDLFVQVVSGGPLDCLYMQAKAAAIMNGDFTPNFTVAMAGKDAELVVAASQAARLRLDLAEASARRFRRAAELGHTGEDMAATYFASFDGDPQPGTAESGQA
jgi:3-hydroxyisobutyrate dehydrogenase